MFVPLLLLLQGVATSTATIAPPPLERLAAVAAPIAVVRVLAIHDLTPQGPRVAANAAHVRIAEAEIERRVLGDPLQTRLFFSSNAEQEAANSAIEKDFRALVFMNYDARDLWMRADSPTRRRLERLEMPCGPALPFANGLWPILGDGATARVRVPQAALPLPTEIASDGAVNEVRLSELLAWLDRAVVRTTPSLRADEFSTGPSAWSLALASDGTWTGSNSGRLELAQLSALWTKLDAERFRELPPRVGTGGGPDSGVLRIRVRTVDGMHEVTIACESQNLVDAEREKVERALRVWRALPGHVAR